MRINLPPKFDKKLDGKFRNFIDNSIENFSDIFVDNKLLFFPEFTDHGLQHIEEVLITASNLISDESYEFLNSEDIAVLTMSIILHDVGMHISSDGLIKLLNGEYDFYKVSGFDSKTWGELWDDFFYEAKRFNEDQLVNIFGSSEIEIVEPNLDKLNIYTIKIYGEFLRRHHHRLAHEIALGGFPTKSGYENLQVESNIANEIVNLCGLVARSHGINLRNTFEYLKDTHDQAWKSPFDVKVFFLMIVLRISDYMQIQSERASKVLLKTKRYSSPISIQEWEKHDAIKHINVNTDDPERIFVDAKPDNSIIYLELIKLLTDIQYELDLSWAVLGEVYGKDDNLKNLKINYRRISSNLDDKIKISKKIDFIPEVIRFNADPELLKLLIGPLYGENPKYGIRELLQNSIDAVKERHFVDDKFDNDIIVSIDEINNQTNKYYITIKDYGVGMTQDTIINFFFKAGASFRNSMVWKKSFIEDNEVKIEKTGRFGVGVLAAFLLGNQFELTTRHYTEKKGYTCKATLNTKQVELKKCDCEIGTFIKIVMSEKINQTFKEIIRIKSNNKKQNRRQNSDNENLDWFNWYQMDKPKITYQVPNEELKEIFNTTSFLVSSNAKSPLKGWYKFNSKDFKSIHWTLRKEHFSYYYYNENKQSKLVCNGFKITRSYQIDNKYPWIKPFISVFDGNARMPLSLSRDYLLNDHLPFEQELIESICEKVIEILLLTEFEKIGDFWIAKDNWLNLEYDINISDYVVVINNKFTLMLPSIFQLLDIKIFYQLWLKDINPKNIFNDKSAVYQAKQIFKDPNYFYKDLLDSSYYNNNLNNWFSLDYNNSSTRNDIQRNDYILNNKLLYMLEKNRLSKSFRENIKQKLYNEEWSIIKSNRGERNVTLQADVKSTSKISIKKEFDVLKSLSLIDSDKLISENFYYVKENFINNKETVIFNTFKDVWEKKFGKKYLIPINITDRINKI